MFGLNEIVRRKKNLIKLTSKSLSTIEKVMKDVGKISDINREIDEELSKIKSVTNELSVCADELVERKRRNDGLIELILEKKKDNE